MKLLTKTFLSILASFVFISATAQSQVTISECTVTYSITGSDASTSKNLANTSKTFLVKGKLTRTDINGQNFKQSIIYNSQTGESTILKEIGNEKYMKNYTKEQWLQENKKFDGMKIATTNETKTILGYDCMKIIATLKDGTSYSIYYAKALTPSTSENPFQFKDIPGLVLEYETIAGESTQKITYTATMINFSPVPASKFEIPKSGYRTLK